MKIGWYKGIGLSCDNFILRKRVYFKAWLQITKYWGIAIIHMHKGDKDAKTL
jgi:hypothetical protein